VSNILHEEQHYSMNDLSEIFTHFSPQDIEEFYQLYQLWSLRQRRAEIVAQMKKLKQQISENEACLKAVSPSTIALAALSQFRAIGVDDIDLLDRMLERGDEWLDHTLQLFERCEGLDMLQEDATQWCTHALEGAYDWLGSMGDINEQSESDDGTIATTSIDQSLSEVEPLPETTEADFLQKLMSEDGEHEEDLQPTEPDNILEQVDPPAQLVSSAEQPANTEQKIASQIRKPPKIYSMKQKRRPKKSKFNRANRTRNKSH
jgi:hypothetical protein